LQILETIFTIDDCGNLTIPEKVLQEMGLSSGRQVHVAYLTQDGQENSFHEFFLSADPIDELSDEQKLYIPHDLLEQSGIPENADLQILCLEGCIFICQDLSLNPGELAAVLDRLRTADTLIAGSSGDLMKSMCQLEEFIDHFQEGAD